MKVSILIYLLMSGLGSSYGKKATSFLPPTFKATFEQSFVSSLSGKTKKTTGFIEYRYPGNIKFITEIPDKITYVSNPDKTWYYTAPFFEGEPGELTIKKTGKDGLNRFFDSLKRGLVSNKLYKVIKSKDHFKLIFTKKMASDLRMKGAILKFKNNKANFLNLNSVQITYLDNKKIVMTLSKIEKNLMFKSKHFVFFPPKNTRISK